MLVVLRAFTQTGVVSVMGEWYFRWGGPGRHPCGGDADFGNTVDKKESTL